MMTFSMRAKSSMEAGSDLISAMPELAEVEYARKRWNPGLGQRIVRVKLHPEKRIFRGTDPNLIVRKLTGQKLLRSVARGKQLLFVFSSHRAKTRKSHDNTQSWLGIHLGMSGDLRVEPPGFTPGKHDHLVLWQKRRALVFRDARQFGRVRFHQGPVEPEWWQTMGPELHTPKFRRALMASFVRHHGRAPIKAVLLNQKGFPGIGNWMADEILWRAHIAPGRLGGKLSEEKLTALWRSARFVARESLRRIGEDNSEPPKTWLLHERWHAGGECPRHHIPLRRATIGGRTTAWCPRCQH
jgi:formamidopyrimidine-DNA glycosylase